MGEGGGGRSERKLSPFFASIFPFFPRNALYLGYSFGLCACFPGGGGTLMLGWLLQRWLKRERKLLKRRFLTNFEPYDTMELKPDFCLSCTIRKWLQHNIDPYP